jgi:hypothetical protein
MVLTIYYYLLLVGETTIAYRSSHIISNLHKRLELYMTIQSLPTSIENVFLRAIRIRAIQNDPTPSLQHRERFTQAISAIQNNPKPSLQHREWLARAIRAIHNDQKPSHQHREWFARSSEVVLCPILYCRDVFSTYLGKILDFVVVHWSFIFISHISRLIVEFI